MANSAEIGLIGYGLAGSAFHAPLIHATPGLELAAIVTSDPERAAIARGLYPAAEIVETTEQLWDVGLDAVVIATPNTSHAPLALKAIEHGLSVVVDKPLALTADQGESLITAAHEADVLLTTFQNRRWDGDFLTVRRLISDGTLGAIARFESRFERFRPTIKEGWREEVTIAEGGGTLFDLGAHLIDQACVLFGKPTEVYAEVDTTRASAKVDDDVFVALTHPGGVRSHLYMSATAADLGPRFRVLGTDAGYRVYGLDVQEEALRAGKVPGFGWGSAPEADWGVLTDINGSQSVPTEAGNYPAFYAGLADALLNSGPAPVDPEDSVNVLRIIAAAQESSASKSVVRL